MDMGVAHEVNFSQLGVSEPSSHNKLKSNDNINEN